MERRSFLKQAGAGLAAGAAAAMKRHFDAQNLSSALFPLLLLLALIGLTYWLRLATELPSPQRDGKHRHDPDYIVYDGTLRKIDATERSNTRSRPRKSSTSRTTIRPR